jgi:hypothetical protein
VLLIKDKHKKTAGINYCLLFVIVNLSPSDGNARLALTEHHVLRIQRNAKPYPRLLMSAGLTPLLLKFKLYALNPV